MVLRPYWLRLHRRWMCFGLGTVCATGLAICGCSRAPLTTFKELTSAPPGSVDATARRSTEEPRSGDAVAKSSPGIGRWRERLSLTGRETRVDKSRRYQEEFAEFGRRVMDSRNAGSRDPFLEFEAAGREFPSTDSLSPRPKPRASEEDQNTVARADLSTRPGTAVDPASVERRTDPEGVTRTQAEAVVRTPNTGIAQTSSQSVASTDPPATRAASRLDQLRAELRSQPPATQEGVARITASTTAPLTTSPPTAAPPTNTPPTNSPPRGDRGVILSAGQLEERTPSTAVPPAIAAGAGESSSPNPSTPEDVALRVQALLAAANWQAERGELEEAYRNVVLAQRLADRAQVTYGPRDRRPEDLAQRIWEAVQRDREVNQIARSLPPPKLPPAAQRRPVPENAFAAGGEQSWRQAEGTGQLRAAPDSLPTVTPRVPAKSVAGTPSTPTPVAAAEAVAAPSQSSREGNRLPAEKNPALASAAGSGSPTASAVGAGGAPKNPITVGAIAPEPAVAPGGRDVVTAHAETVAAPGGADVPPGPATPITVPAMATLPKADRGLPAPGPALPGLPLAKGEPSSTAPPSLSVTGAKRLPPPPGGGTSAAPAKSRLPWGLIGLVAVLLTAAYAFRRRWSAASVKSKS